LEARTRAGSCLGRGRAKTFYNEKTGFNLDVDHRAGDDFRVVQLTPPLRVPSLSNTG
jgi:hypothetical protein